VTSLSHSDLVDRYYQPLFRFALSLARNETAACDLTQETFYLWASKGHQLRDISKVKTWLFTTLYREYLGGERRRRRFPEEEFDPISSELPSVAPDVVKHADGRLVIEALRRVEELYRVPLTLFYLEELSYKQIAQVLEVPIGTVMSRLSRGKAQLRRSLVDTMSAADENVVRFRATP
jgi:RNA polymerase sigma-70 factor (ECF subfamily)